MEVEAIINYLLDFVSIFAMGMTNIYVYSRLNNKKINITVLKFFFLLLFIILSYYNGVNNYSLTKLYISYLLYVALNWSFFQSKPITCILSSLYYFVSIMIFELLYSFPFALTSATSVIMTDQNHLIKLLFTVLIVLNALILFRFKYIKGKYLKILEKSEKEGAVLYVFLLLLSFIMISNITYRYVFDLSIWTYIANLLIFLVFILIVFFILFQNYKMKKIMQEAALMIDFMKEYESVLTEYRCIKHDTINDLLIIKSSLSDKNKKANEVIDEIINKYDYTKNKFLDIGNFPPGLKGLLYYKTRPLAEYGVRPEIIISPNANKKLELLDSKTYTKVYKVFGILLDNAVEACVHHNKKVFALDIYLKNDEICFYLENSTRRVADINKISQRNFSTKGKNRGLGLYMVSRIINNTQGLELEQKINENKNFVSLFKIKTSSL